jgi:TonB family protein
LLIMAPLVKDSPDVANSSAAVPAAPTVPTTAAPKQNAGGTLRADALSLEVPVKVHGSRVTEVARGVAPKTEPFEEETGTMIVFPQGGVLRMSTAVTASQMLVVTNLKTRQDAICRVIKVRTFSNMQGYVEVEFTHQQPGYWGVRFPSEGAPAAPEAAPVTAPVTSPVTAPVISPTAPAAIPETPVQTAPAQDVSWAPAPTPIVAPVPPPSVPQVVAPVVAQVAPPVAPSAVVLPPAAPVVPVVPAAPAAANRPVAPVAPPPSPPSKPEPTFISFGTQEKVQLFASATQLPVAERVAPPPPPPPAQIPAESVLSTFISDAAAARAAGEAPPSISVEIPDAPQAATPPPAAVTLSELRGDQRGIVVAPPADASQSQAGSVDQLASEAAADVPAKSSRAIFGSFSGGSAFGAGQPIAVDAFGTRLDSHSEAGTDQPGASRNNNWILIAACVALLCATGVAGVFYFRPHAANSARNGASTPAIPPALAFQTPAVVPDETPHDAASPHNSAMHPVPIVSQAPAAAATVHAGDPAASGGGEGPRIVPKPASNLAPGAVKDAVDDHPVSSQRADAGSEVQAPSVDAASASDSSNSGALSGIVSSNAVAPLAPDIRSESEGPVKVGGNVKEPKLLTRVMPEYPTVAKEAHIDGDIVVKTTIDVKGNVVNMQVVSGPAMLRGPALAALRRWKYEPSTLNGQPIAVQLMVTLKFSANR